MADEYLNDPNGFPLGSSRGNSQGGKDYLDNNGFLVASSRGISEPHSNANAIERHYSRLRRQESPWSGYLGEALSFTVLSGIALALWVPPAIVLLLAGMAVWAFPLYVIVNSGIFIYLLTTDRLIDINSRLSGKEIVRFHVIARVVLFLVLGLLLGLLSQLR